MLDFLQLGLWGFFFVTWLKSSLRKFLCRHRGLVMVYQFCTMTSDLLSVSVFLSYFVYPEPYLLMHLLPAPNFSGVRVANLPLFLCTCFCFIFGYVIFSFVCVYFPCLHVCFIMVIYYSFDYHRSSLGSCDYSYSFVYSFHETMGGLKLTFFITMDCFSLYRMKLEWNLLLVKV